MKSRITIELDFTTVEPHIRVINETLSDDVKDKLISFFRRKLGNDKLGSYCTVHFPQFLGEQPPKGQEWFTIHPIPPEKLAIEVRSMTRAAEQWAAKQPATH